LICWKNERWNVLPQGKEKKDTREKVFHKKKQGLKLRRKYTRIHVYHKEKKVVNHWVSLYHLFHIKNKGKYANVFSPMKTSIFTEREK
jgi:hypothetical protein